jgi:uncharacterized protein YfaS (alpha-2-macroglobulin family)
MSLTKDPSTATLTPDALAEGITITNTGDDPLWYALTTEGLPSVAQPASSNGLTLSKSIRTMNGRPANLRQARQSERYMVLISGQMRDNTYREMSVLDLLPAGFEIETVLPGGDSAKGQYRWLPKLTHMQLSSARDDRFVGSFNVGSRYRPRPKPGKPVKIIRPKFAVAYVVRAITPGSFTVPAARVEDMYAPRIQARTAENALTVSPAAE